MGVEAAARQGQGGIMGMEAAARARTRRNNKCGGSRECKEEEVQWV